MKLSGKMLGLVVVTGLLSMAPLMRAQDATPAAPDASAAQTPAATPDATPAAATPDKAIKKGKKEDKKLAEDLSLTPDQKKKLKKASDEKDKKIEALDADASADPKSKKKQTRAAEKEFDDSVRGMLTDDQKTKYDAMQAEKKAAGGKKKGASGDTGSMPATDSAPAAPTGDAGTAPAGDTAPAAPPTPPAATN